MAVQNLEEHPWIVALDCDSRVTVDEAEKLLAVDDWPGEFSVLEVGPIAYFYFSDCEAAIKFTNEFSDGKVGTSELALAPPRTSTARRTRSPHRASPSRHVKSTP
jgi:hypothetical protein